MPPAAIADGHERDEDPYYVRLDVHPARGPERSDDASDCAGAKARDPVTSFEFLRHQVHPAETRPNGSVEHLVPGCIAFDSGALPLCTNILGCPQAASNDRARFAYQTGSGNYTLTAASLGTWTGNSGVGAQFDCRDCPPPGLVLP